MQGFTYCGPWEEKCVANQTLRDKNCLIPCTGLFADIMDDSFEKYVIKGIILISSLSCFFDPHTYKQGFHTLTDELAGYSTKDRLHLALQQMLPLLARDGGDGVKWQTDEYHKYKREYVKHLVFNPDEENIGNFPNLNF